MRRIASAAFATAAAVLPVRASSQATSRGGVFEIPFAQLQWVSPSKKDSSAQFATLRVDSATGATQVLWRFRPGATGPCEWHAANQSIVIMNGSIVLTRPGSAVTRLEAGGFAYLPQNSRFRLTVGPEPTLVLTTLDGHLDMHVAAAAECRG
jgi:hypothetical protein